MSVCVGRGVVSVDVKVRGVVVCECVYVCVGRGVASPVSGSEDAGMWRLSQPSPETHQQGKR